VYGFERRLYLTTNVGDRCICYLLQPALPASYLLPGSVLARESVTRTLIRLTHIFGSGTQLLSRVEHTQPKDSLFVGPKPQPKTLTSNLVHEKKNLNANGVFPLNLSLEW
jgi:hypothetical protein